MRCEMRDARCGNDETASRIPHCTAGANEKTKVKQKGTKVTKGTRNPFVPFETFVNSSFTLALWLQTRFVQPMRGCVR